MNNLLESLGTSFGFIVVCILTFVILYGAARLAENKLSTTVKHATGTKRIAYIAIFSALAGVLMLFEIPLFFAPSFYELDLSELPVLIISFYLGPSAGVVTAFFKVLIKLLLKGTSTAFVGDYANFVTSCALVLPAGIVYLKNKTRKGAVTALVVGTLTLTVFGSLFNAFYLIPTFADLYGISVDAIVGMGTSVNSAITSLSTLVLFAVVPFNLLKGTLVSVLTMLLYKRIQKLFI